MATQEELRAQLQARHDKDTIQRAILALAARGCSYRVIEPDGSEHANIQTVEKAPRKMVNKFVEETKYKEVVDAIKEGGSDVLMIPAAKLGDKDYARSLYSSVYNYCKKLWGGDTFKTKMDDEFTHIDITRNEKL